MRTSFAIKRRGATLVGEAHRLVTSSHKPGFRVLTYHAVGNPVDGDVNGIYNLEPGAFRAQLDQVVATAQRIGIPIVPFSSSPATGIAITFDDGYAGAAPGTACSVSDGVRRIVVEMTDGYPYAQLYAPGDLDVICFEPMTAPTNALVSGEGLHVVEPGASFTASFAIAVGRL